MLVDFNQFNQACDFFKTLPASTGIIYSEEKQCFEKWEGRMITHALQEKTLSAIKKIFYEDFLKIMQGQINAATNQPEKQNLIEKLNELKQKLQLAKTGFNENTAGLEGFVREMDLPAKKKVAEPLIKARKAIDLAIKHLAAPSENSIDPDQLFEPCDEDEESECEVIEEIMEGNSVFPIDEEIDFLLSHTPSSDLQDDWEDLGH